MNSSTQIDLIPIGHISKTHGKQGSLQMQPTRDYWSEMDLLPAFVFLRIDSLPVPFRLIEAREKGQDYIISLEGINDETRAQQLCGCEVLMERDELGALEDEEGRIYLEDLIGYQAWDQETPIGTVSNIDESTENTLFVISRSNGDEALIPAHEDFILSIDEEAHQIVFDLPEGLID